MTGAPGSRRPGRKQVEHHHLLGQLPAQGLVVGGPRNQELEVGRTQGDRPAVPPRDPGGEEAEVDAERLVVPELELDHAPRPPRALDPRGLDVADRVGPDRVEGIDGEREGEGIALAVPVQSQERGPDADRVGLSHEHQVDGIDLHRVQGGAGIGPEVEGRPRAPRGRIMEASIQASCRRMDPDPSIVKPGPAQGLLARRPVRSGECRTRRAVPPCVRKSATGVSFPPGASAPRPRSRPPEQASGRP